MKNKKTNLFLFALLSVIMISCSGVKNIAYFQKIDSASDSLKHQKNSSMKNKIQFALSLIFGLLFIFSGAVKIFHLIPTPTDLPEKMLKLNVNHFYYGSYLIGLN